MRKLIFWQIALVISIALNSCVPTPPPSPPPPPPPIIPISLPFPLNTESVQPTVVEFLIDNSDSVERICGDSGRSRFEISNQILSVFRTIDTNLMENLYVGVARFGNSSSNFMQIIEPTPFSSPFPAIPDASDDVGQQSQNFGAAIQQATNEIKDISSAKKHLVIFTDGRFSSETAENVQFNLQEATNNGIFVTVGLICSTNDEDTWRSFANANSNVNIFNLEDAVGKLLEQDLKGFLPGGIAVTPSKNQTSLSVPGYYTSMSMMFWNPDDDDFRLLITDETTGKPFQISEDFEYQGIPIFPMEDCRSHQISYSSPGNRWFLFIRPHTFTDLNIEVTTPSTESGLVELVNNSTLELHFAITENEIKEDDLQHWGNCFHMDLLDENAYRGNSFFVTPVSNPDNDLMWAEQSNKSLYGILMWIPPQFNSPTNFNVKIIMETIDKNSGPTWVVNLPIPVRFKVNGIHGEYLTPSIPETIEWRLDVSSIGADPEIYLVTSLDDPSDLDPFPGPLPNITNEIKGMDAIQLIFEQQCQMSKTGPGEKYICVIKDFFDTLIYQSYHFSVYDYILNDYRFDQLIIIWRDGFSQKATTWMCPLDKTLVGATITCNLAEEPTIEQK